LTISIVTTLVNKHIEHEMTQLLTMYADKQPLSAAIKARNMDRWAITEE